MLQTVTAPAIKIEKGVPLPPHGNVAKRTKYPFADMEVGDSFFVEYEEGRSRDRQCNTISAAGIRWRKNSGNEHRRFATRKVDGGVRIWRTA